MAGPRLPEGELRLSVRIMGDEIAEVRRFVFVPEAWERADRNAQTIATVIGGAGTLLGIVMVIAGTIAAVVSWSRRRFEVRHFLAVGGGLIVLAGIRVANTYPSLLAQLSTAQPLQLQLLVLIGAGAVGVALQATAIGLVAGGAAAWATSGRIDRPAALRVGLALGAIGAGVSALGALGYDGPRGANYAGAAAFVPLLDAAVQPVMTMVMRVSLLLLIVAAAGWLTAAWTRHRALAGALIVLVGGLMGASGSPLNVAAWIASAALAGAALLAVYFLVLRHDVSVVPPAVAVMVTAGTLFQGSMQAYPAALPGAIAGCAVMWAGAYLWFRALSRPPVADRAASDRPVAV